jgi:hypothetical protein
MFARRVLTSYLLRSPVGREQISEGLSPSPLDGLQGAVRSDIRSLDPERFGWGSSGGDVV